MGNPKNPDTPSSRPESTQKKPLKKGTMPRLSNQAIDDIVQSVIALAVAGGISWAVFTDHRADALSQPQPASSKYHPQPVQKDDCFKPWVSSTYATAEHIQYIPLTVHKILPSDGRFKNMYNPFIAEGIEGLNHFYRDINVGFYVGSVHEVTDDSLFDIHDKGAEAMRGKLDELSKSTAVAHTVNIYMLPKLEWGKLAGLAEGRSLELLNEQSGNQVFISYDVGEDPGVLFAHEVGHIFSLKHTHQNAESYEHSCYINGDSICDTPADPGPYSEKGNPDGCKVDDECNVESCGKGFELKQANNVMSYYPDRCITEFSPDQKEVVTCVLQRHKQDLIRDTQNARVVFDSTVRVNCGVGSKPTIQQGIDAVSFNGGGRVEVCAGVYNERLLFDGMTSPAFFDDKYSLNIEVAAAPDAGGNYQHVVVDGQNERDFVRVKGDDDSHAKFDINHPNGKGKVNVSIQGITFSNGKTDPHEYEALFKMDSLGSLMLTDIDVSNATLRAPLIWSPFGGTSITGSRFENLVFDSTGGIIAHGHGVTTLSDVEFKNVRPSFSLRPDHFNSNFNPLISLQGGIVDDVNRIELVDVRYTDVATSAMIEMQLMEDPLEDIYDYSAEPNTTTIKTYSPLLVCDVARGECGEW